ncbi:MAG: chemotaxis protein CheA [Polyangiaceae bacterium]|nr:chemotaxis protein CheA [Polyangiaceae bacterium]
MADATDKAREEFFSEAQEIVEGLSRDLLALDGLAQRGQASPELVNDVFRAVHTLKGLAGLFGATRMATLSHDLEEVLDDLRLGRVELTREVLDLLFRALDVYGQLLTLERAPDESLFGVVDEFLADLSKRVRRRAPPEARASAAYDLDPGLLAVLTEYEEHRLRTCVASGFSLFRVRARFNLLTIDEELEALKTRAKPLGEIVTYLPTGDGGDAESIDLELLLASREEFPVIAARLASERVSVEEVDRRRDPTDAPPRSLREGAALARDHEGAEEPAAEGGAAGLSLRSVSQTVRVDIRKLDSLMNVVGELSIVRSTLARITERVRSNPGLRELGFELYRLQRSFERHLGEVQDGILEVRMVPIGQIFDKLGRVVRQASREAGKQVSLVITGAETEVDKLIVEELSDPLMHMVRNAIDHGIEPVNDRARVGKPEVGTIAINAFQKGSHVLLEIEDDGRGIDRARVREIALSRGILDQTGAAELDDRGLLGLIFLPGFSTKGAVDMLAGRGVGMDVVKTNISRLGGVIDVQSEPGIGTKMTITLPITLAILSSLLVEAGGQSFAVPLSAVEEALAYDAGTSRVVDAREVMTLRGASLPLVHLDALLGLRARARGRGRYVLVVSAGTRRLGVVVDHLEGQQDIVIKPLGRSLASVRGFAGAAQLGDQRVGLVLDAPALIDEVLASGEARKAEPRAKDVASSP